MKPSEIIILTFYTDSWIELMEIALKNREEYCERHGYEYVFIKEEEPFDGFKKLEAIRELFKSGYEIVVSMDCDALITNINTSIEEFINDDDFFFACHDVNGLNCGVFIIKNIAEAQRLLRTAIGYKLRPNMWCEQDAINRYIGVYGGGGIKTLPHPSINSYLYELYPEHGEKKKYEGQWGYGDFVVHLPGVSMSKRKEIMSSIDIVK